MPIAVAFLSKRCVTRVEMFAAIAADANSVSTIQLTCSGVNSQKWVLM